MLKTRAYLEKNERLCSCNIPRKIVCVNYFRDFQEVISTISMFIGKKNIKIFPLIPTIIINLLQPRSTNSCYIYTFETSN